MTTRCGAFAVIAGALADLTERCSSAQPRDVSNDLRITTTGDLYVGQHAAGTRHVYTDSRGNKYYARDTINVVENNGRIVATRDVRVEQQPPPGSR